MKACSTFEEFLADVSRKGMPISSANALGGEWRLCYVVCVSYLKRGGGKECAGFHANHKQGANVWPQGTAQANGGPPHLCRCVVHHPLAGEVALVAHQQLVHILVCIPGGEVGGEGRASKLSSQRAQHKGTAHTPAVASVSRCWSSLRVQAVRCRGHGSCKRLDHRAGCVQAMAPTCRSR